MGKYGGFQSVQLTKPTRSDFDLSATKRVTTVAGRLTPVFITECVPSDTFRGSSEILVRLAPLLAPIYDFLTLYVHFFFVPNRLLWDDWEEFITGGRLGVGIDPVVAPVPPYVDIANLLENYPNFNEESSLLNYLGVPQFLSLYKPGGGAQVPSDYDGIPLDLLPALAYQKCWYDYYRDRNFTPDDVMEFPVASGEHDNDMAEFLQIRIRAWEHDYFTSALPFTQRGEEVLMPLAGTASATYLDRTRFVREDGVTPSAGGTMADADLVALVGGGTGMTDPAGNLTQIRNIDEIIIDGSNVSINDFRSAYALQVWLERNAIGGSRYTESTQAHFGVRPQDSRLQRAEYIGGGRIPIKISEIVATAWSEADPSTVVPLANLAGHGITFGNTNQFSYFCPEHGFIIGIASIMSPPSYYQGLPRMFRRHSFLDYPWPNFAKLGEQQVDKAELYATAANLTEDDSGKLPLFGYQSRYADWKFLPNTSAGAFQSSLLFWTLTRSFGDSPVLGNVFNTYDVNIQQRIFAVNNGSDNFWLFVNNMCHVRRPLPYFGAPNNLGFQ